MYFCSALWNTTVRFINSICKIQQSITCQPVSCGTHGTYSSSSKNWYALLVRCSVLDCTYICKGLFSLYTFSSNFNCIFRWLLHLLVCFVSYVHCMSCSELRKLHWSCCSDFERLLWPCGVGWVKISKTCGALRLKINNNFPMWKENRKKTAGVAQLLNQLWVL